MSDSKKIIKNCLIILAIVICAILFFPLKNVLGATTYDINKISTLVSQGENALGQTILISEDDLKNEISYKNDKIYCIAAYAKGHTVQDISAYIRIQGNKFIAYIKNNNTIYNTGWITGKECAKLGYILGGQLDTIETGYGPKGSKSNSQEIYLRQAVIWHSVEDLDLLNTSLTFYPNSGRSISKTLYTWSDANKSTAGSKARRYKEDNAGEKAGEKFENEMDNYEQNMKNNYKEATITKNSSLQPVGRNISSKYERIGSFSFSYTGTVTYVVTDVKGNTIDSEYLQVIDANGNALSSIPNGSAFYIKNSSGKDANTVKFNVTQITPSNTICADIYIASREGTQPIMIANPSVGSLTTTASVSYTIYHPGSIKITKKDVDTNANLKAGFIVETTSGYLKKETDGTYTYNNYNSQDATVFYTNNGTLTISGLRYGTYKVWEVEAPDGYVLSEQSGYRTREGGTGVGAITGISGNQLDIGVWVQGTGFTNENLTVSFTNKRRGNIELTKKGDMSGENIENVKFIIKNSSGQYIKAYTEGNPSTIEYTTNKAEAFRFTTNASGKISIKNIPVGKYHIYEVEAPTPYEIEYQTNYDSTNKWVDYGEYEVITNSDNKNTEITIINAEVIDINGYVWIDVPGTKDNDYNNLYDDGEEKLVGVKVNLKNKNGNTIATTVTDKNGQYTFSNILETDLVNLYVEFDYSETQYKTTSIPVAFNSTVLNGSRAIYEEIKQGDTDLTGIVSTYKGTEADIEEKYGLSGGLKNFYNNSTNALENINLGIKQLPKTSYTLQQDLQSADINIGGMEYTYTYGKRGDKEAINEYENVPIVKWQGESISSYSADIYPSDIANAVANDKDITATVTYKINIENTTNITIDTLYKENKLIIKQLKNTFDNTRYELADSNWEKPTREDEITTVTMKNSYKEQIYGEGIDSNNTKTAEITFKVKPEAIKEILKYPDGIIEKHPTEATSLAYHKYSRNDYSWDNNIENTQEHYTTLDKQTDTAPYLTFRLSKKDREVSGIVFKDNVKESAPTGEIIGDGIYNDETENTISNVTVELYDKDNNIAKLYTTVNSPEDGEVNQISDSTELDYKSLINQEEAETKTNAQGKYYFAGVAPGEYYIKFTYGDKSQKINNETVTVTVNDYKSTVVTSDAAKKALGYSENSNGNEWYKYVESNNYSVATDNLTTREEYNADNSTHTTITAQTPNFLINSTDISGLDVFNFGIIEQAKQKLEIDKVITNIKITNTQGNVVVNGNPGTDVMAGVTSLDDRKNATGYVKLEIPEDEIYGSKLTVTYEVIVTNVSDINFYENETDEQYGWYYKFGDTSHAIELTTTADTVYDYLDPALTYVSSSPGDRVTEEYASDYSDYVDNQEMGISETYTRDESYDKVLVIKNWEELYSIKTAKESAKTQDVVEIIAEKTLTTDDDDMEFISTAKIITAKDPETALVSNEVKLPDPKDAITTLSAPTGADMQTIVIYAVAGLCAIIILGVGIVIIKKKIL